MTYTYLVLDGPDKDSTIEIEQSIKESALEITTFNGREVQVKRLISAGTGFILKGGTWFRDGYSRGVQSMPTKEDRANFNKPNK